MSSPTDSIPAIEIIRRVEGLLNVSAEAMLAHLLSRLQEFHNDMPATEVNVFGEIRGLMAFFGRHFHPPASMLVAIHWFVDLYLRGAQLNLDASRMHINQAGLELHERDVAIATALHLILQQLLHEGEHDGLIQRLWIEKKHEDESDNPFE